MSLFPHCSVEKTTASVCEIHTRAVVFVYFID